MKISKGTLRKIILEYLSLNEEIIRKKGHAGYEYKYDTATGKITITKAPAGAYKGVVNPQRDKKNKKAYDAILSMHFPDYATQEKEEEESSFNFVPPPSSSKSAKSDTSNTSNNSNTSSTSSTSSTSNNSNIPDASDSTVESDGDGDSSYSLPEKINTSKKINFVEFLEKIKNSKANGTYVYNYNEFSKFYPNEKTFESFSSKEYEDIDPVISKHNSFFYKSYDIYRSPYGKGSSLSTNVFFQPLGDPSGKLLSGRLFFDLPDVGNIDSFILNNVIYNIDKNTFSGK